jgi:putative DNA primase/helicase
LLSRLVQVQTPRPGLHVYYRCEVYGGNLKLARVLVNDPSGGPPTPKTVIEIKGEAGYCLTAPSPPSCHPTLRSYRFVSGQDLTTIPTITACERKILWECAKEFNTWQPPVRTRGPAPARRPGTADRPGDDFNERVDWARILEPHGWSWAGAGSGGAECWCRPGKVHGVSATTNHGGYDLLYVFSANAAPFEPDTAYTKFHAYALLKHDGDFNAAARALAGQGYGRHGRRTTQVDPYDRYGGYPMRSRRQGR